MAQMLPLAGSFSFLLGKLPMLNVPTNLSGLQLSFLPTALAISYKTSIVSVLVGFCLEFRNTRCRSALLCCPNYYLQSCSQRTGLAEVRELVFRPPDTDDD
jgi:hypothetical protein